MGQTHIRNFAIIAHIDHGKSTLADRLLELTHTVEKRDMQEQVLDSNPIERERGITIKLAPVRMQYQSSVVSRQSSDKFEDGKLKTESFILNLIDTPGHVDFTYEVSRSLAACEGALLVVDATQGVQAQTLANLNLARLHNLTIIPIINKIDLPNARIEECTEELRSVDFSKDETISISAKTGENVERVLEAIVERIPSPKGVPDRTPRALVFSSQYDTHKGVVVFVRIVDGEISFARPGLAKLEIPQIRFLGSGTRVLPIEIGYFTPNMMASDILRTGEVGYIATGLKDARLARVGDTITVIQNSNFKIQNEKFQVSSFNFKVGIQALPGYKEPKPMVFLSLFPLASDEFTGAREAMEKLRLSDSAFTFRPIASAALGNGFHCGFLGLLHAEIVQERLEREFDLSMIATAPSVEYLIKFKVKNSKFKLEADGFFHIQSANEFPDPAVIEEVREPIMEVTIFTPKRYVGAVMQLARGARGVYIDLKYLGEQAEFTYLIPLSDMIIDFFDRIKSVSEGYASLDYEFYEFQAVDVAKIEILVNHEKVDALSFIAVRDQARQRSSTIVDRLAQVIPRQQFSIPIQAAIGGEIIARADVKAFRKDVTKKLYGGDRTRKDKLLDKQKKGKAKMKRIGAVEIPQSAFFEVLKRES